VGLGYCDIWWDNRAELTVKWVGLYRKSIGRFSIPDIDGTRLSPVSIFPF
jgi:hypothetical protein